MMSRIITGILLSMSLQAFAVSSITCPELANIQTEGLDQYTISSGNYTVFHQSHYHTAHAWDFSISPIVADNSDTALDEANSLLESAKVLPKPIPSPNGNEIQCIYNLTEGNAQAVARTFTAGVRW